MLTRSANSLLDQIDFTWNRFEVTDGFNRSKSANQGERPRCQTVRGSFVIARRYHGGQAIGFDNRMAPGFKVIVRDWRFAGVPTKPNGH